MNFQRTKYLAIVENHIVKGYYRIEKAKIVDMTQRLETIGSRHKDKPFRVEFTLEAYKVIKPLTYGIDMLARHAALAQLPPWCGADTPKVLGISKKNLNLTYNE